MLLERASRVASIKPCVCVSVGALQQLAEVRAVAHGQLGDDIQEDHNQKYPVVGKRVGTGPRAVLLLWHGED